jgi:hypothetical protein
MSRLTWLLLGAALGFVSSGAVAFQESKGGPGAQPGAKQAPVVKPLDTTGTGTSIETRSGGTEIRIPGLGRLGTLPKFDFGLDLLYGVDETKTPETEQRPEGRSDDFQIRGHIKHRF